MNSKQYNEVDESLVEFIKRVAENKKASPEEIAALPEIAKVLCEMTAMHAT